MDEMQKKYEEELKALQAKNAIIRHERGGKDPVPSTLTL